MPALAVKPMPTTVHVKNNATGLRHARASPPCTRRNRVPRLHCVSEIDSHEARTRLAQKALKHAIECDAVCQRLSQYADKVKIHPYIADCYQNAMVAWDIVEEVYAALADIREKEKKNPLEAYCDTQPSALECREYDI